MVICKYFIICQAMANFNNVKFVDSINEKMPNIHVPTTGFKVKKPGINKGVWFKLLFGTIINSLLFIF